MSVNDWCPCGGGEKCLLIRRKMGEWIHEDEVLKKFNLPIRENCLSNPTVSQINAMDSVLKHYDSLVYKINGNLVFYWN